MWLLAQIMAVSGERGVQATVLQAQTIGWPQPIGDSSWHSRLFLWHSPCDSFCTGVFPGAVCCNHSVMTANASQQGVAATRDSLLPLDVSSADKLMYLCWRLERKLSLPVFSSQYFGSFYLNLCGLEFSFTPVCLYFQISTLCYCLLSTLSHNGAVLSYCWCNPNLSCYCCFTLKAFH